MRLSRVPLLAALLAPHGPVSAAAGAEDAAPTQAMVRIASGRYRPLYRQPARDTGAGAPQRRVVGVTVPAFDIDRRPVTNTAFLAFVLQHRRISSFARRSTRRCRRRSRRWPRTRSTGSRTGQM